MEAEQIASLVDASALEAFRASKMPVLTEELRTILTEVAQTGRLRCVFALPHQHKQNNSRARAETGGF